MSRESRIFINNLTNERKRQKLTQTTIAKRANLKHQTISKIESNPTLYLENLIKYLAILNIDINKLFK